MSGRQDETGLGGAAGEAAAFLNLLEGQKGALFRVASAYCWTAEDRRDLVQEMILQMWRAWPGFDGRSSVGTWVYRIAMNVAISRRRSEGRRIRQTLPIELALDVADGAETTPKDAVMSRILRALIGDLDDMNKALVVLHLDGFSHAEIAETLGTTPGNVGTRLGRIKILLQKQANTKKGMQDGT